MPKVSVIIPCFNQGTLIDEAVNSVLAQTVDDFEIIIVNAGATDEAASQKLAACERPKVRVIRTENQGLPGVRNTGIAAANGKYILPLDSDNKIAKTYLEKAIAVLDANPRVGIVYCDTELFGEQGDQWQSPEYQFQDILLGDMIFCSAFFRRSDWEVAGGYNPNIKAGLEDQDFWLSLIELGREVHRIPEALFYSRKDPAGKDAHSSEYPVERYTQLFKNHTKLYVDNMPVIFEQLFAARKEQVGKSLAAKKQEREIAKLSEQVAIKDAALISRDEEIESLRSELQELRAQNQHLGRTNRRLKVIAAKREQINKRLTTLLAERETELKSIINTLAWRVFRLYGPIKYRYMLPLYRMLKLPPYNKKQSSEPAENALTLYDDDWLESAFSNEAIEDGWLEFANLTSPTDKADWMTNSGARDFYGPLILLPHLEEEQLAVAESRLPPTEPCRRSDVICFSIIDWEFRYQRPQQIMSQFAAHHHRVFYISVSRFVKPGEKPRVRQIKENVYEVQLASLQALDLYAGAISADNEAALLDSLNELRRIFHIDEAVSYVMIASWADVALAARQRFNWRAVYDCMDEWENFPGIDRSLLELEAKLVRQCDLLVVTAQRLFEKWQSYNRPTVLARNAVDYDFYAARYRPNALLADVAHPVLGYYGAIADWFDVDLIAEAARQRPDYTFILLGGVFNVDVSELEKLPNVQLLGQQPYQTMPQYLYHFDVCLIPFKVNAITEATDPVKVYEYLSMGKPVVTVALPELEPLRDYLYVAKTHEEFIMQIDQALAENDAAAGTRRREVAKQHTWAARYQVIEAGIAETSPRASIIVVTYNNVALTRLCLESLIRNTDYPDYEVIVVDNHSTDDTASYLRYFAAQHPHIHILLNQNNEGFARANNQGIAASTGETIVLLNNDTIVPPGWLSRLLRHLENESVGIVGPMTNFVGNEAKLDVPYQTWAEMEEFAQMYTWAHDGLVADIHMLAMFCVAFRRRTYEEVGPLDEQFGIGMFEDDDYAMRIKARGLRVVCAADVFIHHFGQAAFKKLIERGTYNGLFDENRRRYETKWNVKWVPHKHAPLKFEPLSASNETRPGLLKNVAESKS